jgi:hypothetical protein
MNAVAKDPRPRPLSITPPTAAPVRDRGRMMTPAEVAAEIFSGKIKGKWVLQNAPSRYRVPLGRLVCFRELDMIEWRESLTGSQAAG